MDLRFKMRLPKYCFPQLYGQVEWPRLIQNLKRPIYQLFQEYVELQSPCEKNEAATSGGSSSVIRNVDETIYTSFGGLSMFVDFCAGDDDSSQPTKSELNCYLEENCILSIEFAYFDALY
ncbi:hypothetical protein Droror1_Dr00023287 [Drosera rotundifolia]